MIPAISNIETCIVTVNLFDGINNVPYPINIVTTNSAPSFISVPIDQAFSSGHLFLYAIPTTTDLDGDVVTIASTVTTCNYAASVSAGILTMNAPIASIGTCTVTITISDSFNLTPYKINIVTTNAPPSFVTTPTNQAFSSGHSLSYTIPFTTDLDGDVVTIASTVTTCNYAASVSAGILTMNAPIASIGTCTVTLTLSDGFNLTPYTINIMTTNSPPYFSSSLSSGEIINAGITNSYTLPVTSDNDGDTVIISIYQGSSVIASLSGNIININPSFSQVGSFPITIQLSDGYN